MGLLCDKNGAGAIAYAVDNIYDAPWRTIAWNRTDFLPTVKHKYDDYMFSVPNKAVNVASECYPGWPYFPMDILGHDHSAGDIMINNTREAL